MGALKARARLVAIGHRPRLVFFKNCLLGAAPDHHQPSVSLKLALTKVAAEDSAATAMVVDLEDDQVGGS